MPDVNLTGRWIGHYYQRGEGRPITAEFLDEDGRLRGAMVDGHSNIESSVFDTAFEAGLPPGADKQIEAGLREMMPDSEGEPIRHVSRLPADSLLDGSREGNKVEFIKTYQGSTFGGWRVGEQVMGVERPGHSVHYEGRLGDDGDLIEGMWWIDANIDGRVIRTEGYFELCRAEAP